MKAVCEETGLFSWFYVTWTTLGLFQLNVRELIASLYWLFTAACTQCTFRYIFCILIKGRAKYGGNIVPATNATNICWPGTL